MKMDCKVELKLKTELVEAKQTMLISTFLNGAHCLDWHVPLDKFQNEKVLTITEAL